MEQRVGFIGAGNMAQAIFRRLLQAGVVPAQRLWISDIAAPLTAALQAELGVAVAADNVDLVRQAEVIVLAVKPIFCQAVLKEIAPVLGEKPLLSIVTGWTAEALRGELGDTAHVLRVMPNTPAMVGEGMTLLSTNHSLTDQEFVLAKTVFGSVGKTMELEDRLFNAATCISGCGPAFIYQCIEALGDAGVMHGLPRATAYQLAAQMVTGAGKMVRETGQHPGALKDAVCSPGGTTIQGVYALEQAGVRAALIDAVSAALRKTDATTK